jgi:hypothetical protein
MMSNPQKTRTVQGIVRAVQLFLRSDMGSGRVCILVEGSDDAKLYSGFFKNVRTCVMVVKSAGKSRMEESLRILLNETNRAIGICDADFSHLDKNYPAAANIFLTDYHDIEMTMFGFADVFRAAWSKFSLRDNTEEIMRSVLQEISHMAYIRWYNQRNQCNVVFRGLDFTSIFKIQDGKIEQDKKRLLDALNRRSFNKTRALSSGEITAFIRENRTDDSLNLCNGHDVIMLIVLILEHETKECISREDFYDVLRGSFQLNHFMRTRLYGSLFAWQKINKFDILKLESHASSG